MVSGVDNNRQAEVDNRNRNEATRKESELNQKHAKEIARMQQEHYEKIKQLQDAHEKQMETQREASRGALTSRDLKYQQEMEDIRRMNREKVMGLTSQYEDKMQRTREDSQNMVEKERQVNETQRKVLSENLLGEIQRKDKLYSEALNQNRSQQQEGMKRERDTLNEKHALQSKYITKERNETVERLQDDLRNTSRSKRSMEKDLKTQLFDQKQTMQANYMDEISKERRINGEQQDLYRQGYQNSLEDMQKKYSDALYDEKMRNADNMDGLKDDVRNRQNDHVAMLERRVKEANDGKTRQTVEVRRLADLEKNHLLEAMQNNLDASERTRQMALSDSNQKNAENIRDITKKNSDLLHRQHVYNQDRNNLMKVQHEEELSQKTGVLELENERIKLGAAVRDKQRSEMTERERQFLEDYYNRNLTELKRSYDQSLVEQREVAVKERSQAIERVTAQMRANEAKAQDRAVIEASRHEKQLQDVKSQHLKEIETQRRGFEARISSDQKLAVQNLESQKMKYETQLAQQKEAYEERLREMQKTHDQDKINMTSRRTT